MATRSMPFWPRPATTSGSSWPGSGLCAPFSGRLSWSGITRAAPLPHPPEHANSLFHRRLDSQRRCLDFMIDAGSNGLCILANFSEQFVLSDEEREVLTDLTLEHVA